jgi:hypothetical protein
MNVRSLLQTVGFAVMEIASLTIIYELQPGARQHYTPQESLPLRNAPVIGSFIEGQTSDH